MTLGARWVVGVVFVLVADNGSEVGRRRGFCFGEEMTLGVRWVLGVAFVLVDDIGSEVGRRRGLCFGS